ncbi:MAG: EF-hand domain-containing protein [Nibricoccus sp.]
MNISSSNGASRPDPAEMRTQMFKNADADGSGSISKDELTQALANRPQGGRGPQGAGEPPDADKLFEKLDADGDGEITESEHEEGLKAMDAERQAKMGSLDFAGSSDKLRDLIDAVLKKDDKDSDSTDSTDATSKEDLIKELIARLTQESQKANGYSSDGSEDTNGGTNLFSATV